MSTSLFSRSSYYLNKKRYFGSCVFFISEFVLLSVAVFIQFVLLLSNWNHFHFLYCLLYQVFVLYARVRRSANLEHLNESIPQHHLCTNLANEIVSCELVGYEILLSYSMPNWTTFKTSPSSFISSIRQHEVAVNMILTSPFGAIYESYTVHDLECFLVHSEPTNYEHLSVIYKDGVILYLHGGAFVSGSAKVLHRFMTYLHLFTDLPVIGVDYHLAPEYPLQSGKVLDDGYNIIVKHLHEEMHVDLDKIYLIGDSAGGALVMMIMQHLSIKGYGDLGGGVMISPGIEMDNDPKLTPSLRDNEPFDVFLSMDAIDVFKQWIFGCRDVNGQINHDINEHNGSVAQCVETEVEKLKTYLFDKASWNAMGEKTNMLFVVCEYEILRDGVINVYNMSLEFGINAQLHMIRKSNIHALPVMVGAPEAIKAISHMSYVIKSWNAKTEACSAQ